MNIALLIIYIIAAVSLLEMAYFHGKEKAGKHNFWTSLIFMSMKLVIIWWATGWTFI